jgi:hypothetical protein
MSNNKKKGLSQFLYEQRKKKNLEEEETKKKENDVERILVQSKQISKDVAIAGHRKQEMPYKKVEFKTLVDYAIDVVAANFYRYPDMSGIHEHYKAKVSVLKSDLNVGGRKITEKLVVKVYCWVR